MGVPGHFRPEDSESLRRASALSHARGWRTDVDVDARLQQRAHLVSEVESGYADNMDEYSNDLYVRLWFDDLLPLVTPVAAAWLREHLEPVDDRFMAATTEPLRPFHGKGRWHRVPRVLVGCLREKFIRMGVVPEGAGLPPGPDRP